VGPPEATQNYPPTTTAMEGCSPIILQIHAGHNTDAMTLHPGLSTLNMSAPITFTGFTSRSDSKNYFFALDLILLSFVDNLTRFVQIF
jgi:hypothetical protein